MRPKRSVCHQISATLMESISHHVYRMDITTFLAQMWGPAVLAIGVGIFINPKYYARAYREIEKEPLALLVFSMMAITAGVAHIYVHNMWNTFPQIVVSLLGWGLFIKGVLLAVAPNFVDKAGDWYSRKQFIPAVGGLTVVIGVYLTWFAYIS